MPNSLMTPDAAAEFLSVLEKQEAGLLSWGLADGSFSEAELDEIAEGFLTQQGLWGVFPEADQLIELAERRRLVFPFRLGTEWRYRTRTAEAVRLMLRLRQLFPKHMAGHGWASAPRLVADARFVMRPRSYPRRHVKPARVAELLAADRLLTPELGPLLDALLNGRDLSDFQVRAVSQILRGVESAEPAGTVVCAGTGSGKTLAFYLPALSKIVQTLDGTDWVRCLAIYPRTELLKDQFTETYRQARLLDRWLRETGRRPVRLGALFGPTPRHARALDSPWPPEGWRRVQGGYVSPLMRCPRSECSGELVWHDEDRQSGTERLRCSAAECGATVDESEVVLTRDRLLKSPPDILFTTTEMLNQRLSDSRFNRLFGVGRPVIQKPRLLLLDEAHTYSGTSGAQTALLLRRWQHAARCQPHIVGLSATLRDARRFFASLTGLPEARIDVVGPRPEELYHLGTEYLLALRGDPASGASLLSTTLQASMLLHRTLDPAGDSPSGGLFGRKQFLFTDDLDVTNRIFFNLRDAEGEDSWGNPDPAKRDGSLANLRSPGLPEAGARFRDGQSWDLCEWIGHPLRHDVFPRIGRTSSQDAGVDWHADSLVATASLEVGFNDPAVGAVLQHKAPLDPAAFLQRKGRAGRDPRMRPWTVVVLSDFGRDRVAWQSYDLLFDPELPPRELPVGNRHVLRMQAAFAMMDWLGFQLEGFPQGSVWQDLSVPWKERSPGEQNAVRRRQERIAVLAEELLDRPERREDLAAWLQRALRISADEVDVLFWSAPRPLLTGVVPTLIRRLRTGWRRIDAPGETGGVEFFEHNSPLPEFVPRALFQDLNLPEVTIVTAAQQKGDDARRDRMRIGHALAEFAPGRVSRRFGLKHRYARHWVAPLDLSGIARQDLPLSAFVTASEEIGRLEFVGTDGGVASVRCVRPWEIRPTTPDRQIVDSSNSILDWRTQIVPFVAGTSFAPPSTPWAALISEIGFLTHSQNCPVEVRRFATGAHASVGFENGTRFESAVRFTEGGEARQSAAIGFAHDADAVVLRLKLPIEPHALLASRPELVRKIRPDLFRDRVRNAAALDGKVNSFGRERLAQAYLCAVLSIAVSSKQSLGGAIDLLKAGDAVSQLTAALDVLFQAAPPDDSFGETEGDGSAESPTGSESHRIVRQRGHQRLVDSLQDPAVLPALHAAAAVLSEPPDATWDAWLKSTIKATVGIAVLNAVQSLCPDIDASSVLVDPEPGPRAPNSVAAVTGTDEVWLTETAVGGGGVLEKLQQRYGSDPRRFFQLLSQAILPTEFEIVDAQLTWLLDLLAAPGETSLQAAVAELRANHTGSHDALVRAFRRVTLEMRERGILLSHSVTAAVNLRLLRAGSSHETDRLLHRLIAEWQRLEDELDVEIDERSYAWLRSADPALCENLRSTLDAGSDVPRSWFFGVVTSLLWPRRAAARRQRLRTRNPYAALPVSERELVAALLPPEPPPVRLSDPSWAASAEEALLREDSVTLRGANARDARRALLEMTARPIDAGLVLLHPRPCAARRDVAGAVEIAFDCGEGSR